ncbi:hypothetical protein AB9P05_20720 [Roseivirga sp. BDSF3-8]|uniref:WD40 repeat domain-containing protein n=1 Tax=Roseivirga sp. BDSF3-8 TaxID=3241598 RepID=UPI003531F508
MKERYRDKQILDSPVRAENPFPGLRPFTVNESHLFFGREGQSDEVLLKLSEHRFTAVIGASGTGKSSLMYCGLIPILHGGFMTGAGSRWQIIVTRPGVSPIDNLAESIMDHDPTFDGDQDDHDLGVVINSTILRSSSLGLVDAVSKIRQGENENILLLVDQFEELLRYRKLYTDTNAVNESTAYVNLLLEAVSQSEVPVYVALTMRSDFIGDCAMFPDLTHMINKSHYLIPQMTRDQLRMAVEGPVAVGNGKISQRLVQELLNDIGDNPDQLPVLQHALMRTWDYWKDQDGKAGIMDIRHYHAIGTIAEALSEHANEAYDELTKKEQEICEVIFKSLTEKGADNYGTRRPADITTIASIAEVTPEQVIRVVEKFREPGRSLLLPDATVPIYDDTVIEVSHESLMRIWERLRVWVEEEFESAKMYRRLSDAATMYQVGRTSLWRPPDLQLALNWQQKQRPTRIWAQRYDDGFERAIVFLESSRVAYENEQKSKEKLQKRLLQRTRRVAVILGVFAVVSILFFVFAIVQKVDADNQARLAIQNEQLATEQKELALQNEEVADSMRRLAVSEREEAQLQRDAAERNARNFQIQKEVAERQRQVADEQRKLAERQTEIAEWRTYEAEEANQFAQEQALLAENRRKDAYNLRLISLAQSMAVKSLQITEPQLQGLLALQAYKFNTEFGGNAYDHYIYDGLYYAVKNLSGDPLTTYSAHTDGVRSLAGSRGGQNFYSAGSDGKIFRWSFDQSIEPQLVYDNEYASKKIIVHPNHDKLLNLGNMPYVQELSISGGQTDSNLISLPVSRAYDIAYAPDGTSFYILGIDGLVYINDGEWNVIGELGTNYRHIEVSPRGFELVASATNGEVAALRLINTGKKQIIIEADGVAAGAVSFNADGQLVAIGNDNGQVKIYNRNNKSILNILSGQKSLISAINFFQGGKFLATASLDGSVQLWIMGQLDKQPFVLKDHYSYVWDIMFSPDGKYLLTANRSGVIKSWPVTPDLLAEKFCDLLQRNLTSQEWDRYVAEDIPYDDTCNKLSGDNATAENGNE